jgi:hypothetical protein
MNSLVNILSKSGLLSEDLEYHLLRASMVIIFRRRLSDRQGQHGRREPEQG